MPEDFRDLVRLMFGRPEADEPEDEPEGDAAAPEDSEMRKYARDLFTQPD
jgi:hypothetical protein